MRDRTDCLSWSDPGLRDRRGRGGAGGPRRAVFVDRDGTLNEAPAAGRYIRDPRELRLLPGVARAIRTINSAGALAVLFTNQRWLAAPGVPRSAFLPLAERLRDLLAKEGAYLDAYYVCPHQAGTCACRKPAPGMLRRAEVDLGVDLSRSVTIGDSPADVAAGRAAGVRSALLVSERESSSLADRVFPGLAEAVVWAL